MKKLNALWKETKEFVDKQEKEIAEKYINFLCEVARAYIEKDIRVFFKENRVVHYGEGGFGWMIIESNDDTYEVFGEYILEIRFESKISDKGKGNYIEIKEDNLKDIKYEI